jgi:hypothetical protein
MYICAHIAFPISPYYMRSSVEAGRTDAKYDQSGSVIGLSLGLHGVVDGWRHFILVQKKII